MKKIILSLAILATTVVTSFAQHTQTTTGFSNTCDEIGNLTTNTFLFDKWPNNGGWDNSKVDTIKFGYFVAANNAQAQYAWLDLKAAVNLTAPSNKLDFYMSAQGSGGADTTQVINIALENAGGAVSDPVSMTLQKAYSHQQLTFTAATGKDLSAVTRITFTMANANPVSRVALFFVTKLKAGSVIASTSAAASANISSTKVYPNPVSDMANIELNLKSASNVKVVLSDLMGKEVMTIAEGTMSSLTKEFSVANLNKGMYTVSYFVDGAAAKSEMLMVK